MPPVCWIHGFKIVFCSSKYFIAYYCKYVSIIVVAVIIVAAAAVWKNLLLKYRFIYEKFVRYNLKISCHHNVRNCWFLSNNRHTVQIYLQISYSQHFVLCSSECYCNKSCIFLEAILLYTIRALQMKWCRCHSLITSLCIHLIITHHKKLECAWLGWPLVT
jgi:hypothetical protein